MYSKALGCGGEMGSLQQVLACPFHLCFAKEVRVYLSI